MPTLPGNQRLQCLVEAILNENITADELREFEQLLGAGADCVEYYTDLIGLHLELFEFHRLENSTQFFP